jgi:hypothetical protein
LWRPRCTATLTALATRLRISSHLGSTSCKLQSTCMNELRDLNAITIFSLSQTCIQLCILSIIIELYHQIVCGGEDQHEFSNFTDLVPLGNAAASTSRDFIFKALAGSRLRTIVRSHQIYILATISNHKKGKCTMRKDSSCRS